MLKRMSGKIYENRTAMCMFEIGVLSFVEYRSRDDYHVIQLSIQPLFYVYIEGAIPT
jgi:hypothetical protein